MKAFRLTCLVACIMVVFYVNGCLLRQKNRINPVDDALDMNETYSFVFFLCGDTTSLTGPYPDLTPELFRNISDAASLRKKVKFGMTVFIDQSISSRFEPRALPGQTLYYHVGPGGSTGEIIVVGEKDTGNPATLKDFLEWSARISPSSRHILFLGGHGSGVVPTPGYYTPRAIAYDDVTKTYLSLSELAEALSSYTLQIGKKIDLIVFDACLMAGIEIFSALSPYADYAVATQGYIVSSGFPYALLGESLKAENVTPESIGRTLVDLYKQERLSETAEAHSHLHLALIDLGRYPDFEVEFKTFTAELRKALNSGFTPPSPTDIQRFASPYYGDLFDYIEKLSTLQDSPPALKESAIRLLQQKNFLVPHFQAERLDPAFYPFSNPTGISIFLPDSAYSNETAISKYSDEVFAKATGWDIFQKEYWSRTK